MAYLHIDPWPCGLVIAVALAVIAVVRALDRGTDARAAERTRRALEAALADSDDP
jgi:hypothetical protein